MQIHIKVLQQNSKIMVHRKIEENGFKVIHRSVTIHSIGGLVLSQNSAIVASFDDTIKVTHKGKHLQVILS